MRLDARRGSQAGTGLAAVTSGPQISVVGDNNKAYSSLILHVKHVLFRGSVSHHHLGTSGVTSASRTRIHFSPLRKRRETKGSHASDVHRVCSHIIARGAAQLHGLEGVGSGVKAICGERYCLGYRRRQSMRGAESRRRLGSIKEEEPTE